MTGRGAKYRAVPTTVDGIRFASKAEARRYAELKLMQGEGLIMNLELQPVFPLVVCGVKIGKYIADFRYIEHRGPDCVRRVVEDCKGFRTPIYRLKKKLVEALYPGVVIREVSA